jgi:hypothetical protein
MLNVERKDIMEALALETSCEDAANLETANGGRIAFPSRFLSPLLFLSDIFDFVYSRTQIDLY